MASANVTENSPDSNIVWYMFGDKVPPGSLSRMLSTEVLPNVLRQVANYAPTTYEAAQAYLHEELKKPKGQRDLHREMCAFVLIAPPSDPEVFFRADTIKSVIPLHSGSAIVYPTVDLPPDAFGTFEEQQSALLVGREKLGQREGKVFMTYLTRVGSDPVASGSNTKSIQLDTNPFD